MKNIFQGFRDLPDYPRAAIRVIAFLFVLFGIGNLIVGATLNISNQYTRGQKYTQRDLDNLRGLIIPIVEQISVIHGMTPIEFEGAMEKYSPRLYYPDTPSTLADANHVYPGGNGTNYGAYAVLFWGVAYLLTALWLVAGFRDTTLLILIVWIIYSCIVIVNFITPTKGLPLFSNDIMISDDPSMEYIKSMTRPSFLSIFIMIIIPLLIGAFLVFDERLKAYFGKGRFAEAYKTYFATRKAIGRSGERKPLPNPWIVEKSG